MKQFVAADRFCFFECFGPTAAGVLPNRNHVLRDGYFQPNDTQQERTLPGMFAVVRGPIGVFRTAAGKTRSSRLPSRARPRKRPRPCSTRPERTSESGPHLRYGPSSQPDRASSSRLSVSRQLDLYPPSGWRTIQDFAAAGSSIPTYLFSSFVAVRATMSYSCRRAASGSIRDARLAGA
jgi:hypothetical protein